MAEKTVTETAVILAGGPGKRLEGFETIKPLVRLGGKPLILWMIEYLQDVGIKKIFVVVPTRDTLVKRALLGEPAVKAEIEYVEQDPESNSMLGSIAAMSGRAEGPLFVTPCDLIFEKNPFALFEHGDEGDGLIRVLIGTDEKSGEASGATARVELENDKIVKTGVDLAKPSAYEIGILHLGKEVAQDFFKQAATCTAANSLETLLKDYIETGRVRSVDYGGSRWFDVNTPAVLIRAELFLRSLSSQQSSEPRELRAMTSPITLNYQKPVSFDVFVERGLLEKIKEYEIIPHESYYSKHCLIVDKNIDSLYGEKVLAQFRELGYNMSKLVVDPGEWSKSVDVYLRLANQILGEGIDKKSIILSLGGGVIKDIAGFLAATLYRGVGSIHIPTTVLAQCDAAIGFKQGVNGEGGKNLIGSYYAPLKILVDPDVLATLDDRYVSDGLSECLKQAFAQDKKYFDFFAAHEGKPKDIPFLEDAIRQSIKLKIDSLEKDFYEDNVALVYQYGHEIGHAVEYLSGYKLGHGEAVAVGMRTSAELACLMGISDEETLRQQVDLMKRYALPTTIPRDIKADDIINLLRCNKKFHGGEAKFVLIRKIGEMWHDRGHYFVSCGDDVIREAINRSYEESV
ncbi:MAG: NTP transferase domain-containing protein [Patescibacteria group bacterium]|nr:NTP transferase domain-containing protein [Patescibacteria group bacterium]